MGSKLTRCVSFAALGLFLCLFQPPTRLEEVTDRDSYLEQIRMGPSLPGRAELVKASRTRQPADPGGSERILPLGTVSRDGSCGRRHRSRQLFGT